MGSYGFLWVLKPGRTWMDPDGPGRTRIDPDGPGRTRTDPDGPGWTWTDPDGPGVLIGSKRFFQTLELMTVEYALAT